MRKKILFMLALLCTIGTVPFVRKELDKAQEGQPLL